MPQLDIALYIPQLFWLGVFFLILFFGIYFFIEPRFQKIFQNRSVEINEKLQEIAHFQKETEELFAQSNSMKRQLQEWVEKLMQVTTSGIDERIQSLKEDHHKKFIHELSMFGRHIETDRSNIQKDLERKEEECIQKIFDHLMPFKRKS